MTDLPDVKIKALVSFPSTAVGGTAIDVAKSDGKFIIDIDYSEIAGVGPISASNLATTFILLWAQTPDVYQRISLADLKTTLGIS